MLNDKKLLFILALNFGAYACGRHSTNNAASPGTPGSPGTPAALDAFSNSSLTSKYCTVTLATATTKMGITAAAETPYLLADADLNQINVQQTDGSYETLLFAQNNIKTATCDSSKLKYATNHSRLLVNKVAVYAKSDESGSPLCTYQPGAFDETNESYGYESTDGGHNYSVTMPLMSTQCGGATTGWSTSKPVFIDVYSAS